MRIIACFAALLAASVASADRRVVDRDAIASAIDAALASLDHMPDCQGAGPLAEARTRLYEVRELLRNAAPTTDEPAVSSSLAVEPIDPLPLGSAQFATVLRAVQLAGRDREAVIRGAAARYHFSFPEVAELTRFFRSERDRLRIVEILGPRIPIHNHGVDRSRPIGDPHALYDVFSDPELRKRANLAVLRQ